MTEQSNQQDPNLTKTTATEPTATPTATPTPTATTPGTTGGKVFTEDEVEKLVKDRLEREKKAREKAIADATAKAAEEAAKQQGEWEKVAKAKEKEAETLLAELKSLKLSTLRTQIAKTLGLPDGLEEFLIGDDEDAIKASAQKLLEKLPKPTPAPEPQKRQPGPVAPANPGANGQQGETLAEKRTRIHGSPSDPFDVSAARSHGGGAFFRGGKGEE